LPRVSAVRPAAAALAALAAACTTACGGPPAESHAKAAREATAAAQGYVQAFARRDGHAMCSQMTTALQRQFVAAARRAAHAKLGSDCASVMQAALAGVQDDQAASFARARIANVQVKDRAGTFTYKLGELQVLGKVARGGDGRWRVSCCVQVG
jgi:hypothetical protein